MKNLHLKIFSLIFFSLITASSVLAYQTLAFDFPKGAGNWIVAYHRKFNNETIVQYVPLGETHEYWNQTFIIHSYRNSSYANAYSLLRNQIARLEKINSYSKYQFERKSNEDAIATRCVVGNERMLTQCDIYRAIKSFNGYITVQYINKSIESFNNNYLKWLEAIRRAQPYQAAFRNDRYLSKDNFEL
ncbi:hypothetical protein IJG72_00705 [bacterium]|nr:hypothetical protein [bacterium]